MLVQGFINLKDANPKLEYNVILDVLAGINEFIPLYQRIFVLTY